jgi:hypothetical protein
MTTISAELLTAIAQAVAAALSQQQASPKANNTQPVNGAAPKATSADRLAHKDRALIAGFKRKGFADVILMDRTDPTKPFNVKPFQA